jgi:hypothetical protein
MKRSLLLALAPLAVGAPAMAEVKSAAASGFEIESRAVVPTSPADTYRMLGRIGEWWNPAHSYSGDAANLSLEPSAGGCFCETMPKEGGKVEHMRVLLSWPGSMLRLQGGLGPLQGEGASGTLTWTLRPSGKGSEIVQNYIVGGYFRGGADKLAPIVDKVMAEQLDRLKARLSR